MPRKLSLVLLFTCATLLAGAAAYAAEEANEEATFELKGIEAKDAATLVRTIAGVRGLRIADDKTLVVQGNADDLALVAALLGMAEALEPPDEGVSANDGSVVVALRLKRAAPADVMAALRTEVKVARVVAMEDGRMFLRDTAEQIDAARAVIRELDGTASE